MKKWVAEDTNQCQLEVTRRIIHSSMNGIERVMSSKKSGGHKNTKQEGRNSLKPEISGDKDEEDCKIQHQRGCKRRIQTKEHPLKKYPSERTPV